MPSDTGSSELADTLASDTASPDVGSPDAGLTDTTSPDTGTLDATSSDASSTDIAAEDAHDSGGDVQPDSDSDVGAPDVVTPVAGWSSGAPLPEAVTENAVAELDGFVYSLGGFVGFDIPATVRRYDPASNEWSTVAPLPETGFHHVSVAGVGGKLYVVAAYKGIGFTPSDAVFIYDPIADSWSSGAQALLPRGAAGVGVIDGIIYVAGGGSPQGRSNVLMAYDPDADEWTELEPMVEAREHVAACVLDGRLHVFGGRLSGLNNVATHEIYDPAADEWTTGAPLPTARSGIAAARLGSACHVFGGEQSSGTFDEHEVYQNGQWTTLPPMPTARHGLGAATVDGRIMVIGGGPEPGFTYSDAVEIWTP